MRHTSRPLEPTTCMTQPAAAESPPVKSVVAPTIVPEPIVIECELPHSPALVWRALTERELLGAWLLPNDMRPEVGARFSFDRADPPDAHSNPIECEVLEVETNRVLRWRQMECGDAGSSWRPVTSVVTVELTANDAGGTHLRLVHGEFATVSRAQAEPRTKPVVCRLPSKSAAGPTAAPSLDVISACDEQPFEIVCQLRWAA